MQFVFLSNKITRKGFCVLLKTKDSIIDHIRNKRESLL